MKAKTLASSPVVTMEAHETILATARKMREFHVGVIVVTRKSEGGEIPMGILTDRDIVVEAVSRNLPADTTLIAEIMSEDLVCAHEGGDIHSVIVLMKENGVRRVPLVDEKHHLKGIVSLDDLLDARESRGMDISTLPRTQRNWEREARGGSTD